MRPLRHPAANIKLRRDDAALRAFLSPPLPRPAPVHRHWRSHRQPGDRHNLRPVVHLPMLLAPSSLLRRPDQVNPGHMMVVPDLGPAHAAAKAFRAVGAGARRGAVEFPMVAPLAPVFTSHRHHDRLRHAHRAAEPR